MAKEKKTKGTKNNIQPLADRVLVRREDVADTKSPGGIIIPDTAQKEKSKIGVVLAVGSGRFGDEGTLIPMTVKVGAKVIFNSGWDNEVDLPAGKAGMGDKETEYFLIRESDILAVIK
ncbi:MAG TPA: co-chaperone GroES [Candidatus Paceibacterota bacterium]